MSSPDRDQQESAAFRTRRFRLALMTGFAGRGASLLVQIVALPLAIAALGPEKFGAYAMLAAILSWVNVASVTITPGVTMQLVDSNARNDRHLQQTIFSSALFFAAALAGLLFIGIQVGAQAVGVEALFGAQLLKFHDELSDGLVALSALMAGNIILGVAEAAQAGYQNQYMHNIFSAGGSLITVVVLVLLVRAEPTVANMVVAVYAPPLAARAMSMIQLLFIRPYLLPRPSFIVGPVLRSVLMTSAAFSLITFAAFGYQSFSVYWVGRTVGPTDGGLMALCVMILNVSGSALLMLTQPLWPAVRDAVTRDDLAWVRSAYRRTIGQVMIYVVLASLIIAVSGGYLARHWVKLGADIDMHSQWFLGLYFLLVAWEHLNYSFLIGLGHQWYAALTYTAGASLMLVCALAIVGGMGLSGMLMAMCAGPLLTTAWLYPLRIAKLLRPVRLAPQISPP